MCISDVVDSQCPSRPAAVISSIVFDSDIVFSAITTAFLADVDQSNLNLNTGIARPVSSFVQSQLSV